MFSGGSNVTGNDFILGARWAGWFVGDEGVLEKLYWLAWSDLPMYLKWAFGILSTSLVSALVSSTHEVMNGRLE